jgi:hypothetical protein
MARWGQRILQDLTMTAPQIQGALVISLDWDTQADLDLHVQLPSDGDGGVNEIWSRKPSGLQTTPGTTATVDDGKQAGYLDYDSNSMCVIDGRRSRERDLSDHGPIRSLHRARRHVFAVFGSHRPLAVARFREWRRRPRVYAVFGQSTDIDTRFPHGQGQGLQALVFDY